MRRNQDDENGLMRVELKYCERCGGLWLRECGSQAVYCGKCHSVAEDLPMPKKRPTRVQLPVRRKAVVDRYVTPEDDSLHMKAAGGVA